MPPSNSFGWPSVVAIVAPLSPCEGSSASRLSGACDIGSSGISGSSAKRWVGDPSTVQRRLVFICDPARSLSNAGLLDRGPALAPRHHRIIVHCGAVVFATPQRGLGDGRVLYRWPPWRRAAVNRACSRV